MGLVKTRRLAAMQKQQRAIHLRQDYCGLKAGMHATSFLVRPTVRTYEGLCRLWSNYDYNNMMLWSREDYGISHRMD